MCGFGAITFAAKWTGYDTPTSMLAAGALIFLAMVFDGLDGAAARWTNHSTEFGAQLDSLCDAISFGAAPAFLMLALAQPLGYHPRVLWVAAALYVVCTVLRLARFNVQSDAEEKPKGFTGLPSPAAASVVASFPIMLYGPQLLTDEMPGGSASEEVVGWVAKSIPLVTFAVACLMVSRVRYPHLLRQMVRGKKRSRRNLVTLVFALAIIVAVPRVAVPLLVGWYAFAAPVAALWNRPARPQPAAPAPPAEAPTPPDVPPPPA